MHSALTKVVSSVLLGLALCACSSEPDKNTTAEQYFRESIKIIDSGQPYDAIEILNLAIRKDPNYFDAYYNRAVMYYVTSQYPKALADFDKAVSLNPKSASAYAGRGVVYDELRKPECAVADYKVAAKLGDEKARALLKSQNIAW